MAVRGLAAASLIFVLIRSASPAGAGSEPAPLRIEGVPGVEGETLGRWSERTVVLALEVSSEQARLVGFTLKDRPFVAPLVPPEPRISDGAGGAQIEVALLGPSGERFTRRIDLPGICLEHPAGEPPHILGDTIKVHADTILIEVPEIEGFDRIEAATYGAGAPLPLRKVLAQAALDAEHFTPAGGEARYGDLAFASMSVADTPIPLNTPGDVFWPESFGDPDVLKIYGNPAEVDRRINITIVPDGYTYAEKPTLLSNADALVAYLRAKTPYKEHDPFINYILVYAYSAESGTDECDCGVIRNTAMSTGFPMAGFPCGDSGNRCLYYGSACDTNTSFHIAQAEMRAPASDTQIVMVNTTRYGGCGGQRAVYSGGNSFATDVGAHEMGHSLAGLADEYSSQFGCGTVAGGVNTSLNSTTGSWPEWIPEIGPPWQGAQYYSSCIYRPQYDCTMHSLGSEFCSVCRQRWALTYFGHPRVSPTAPVASISPPAPLLIPPGTAQAFSIATRFAAGPSVTNSITWRLQGPGFPTPTTVATDTNSYSRTFTTLGSYTLTCEVIADTNFIKPAKNGANRDLVTWQIDAVVDADGDGYFTNVDCNDANPAVHPGAVETCNGVDDDCDAAVDEGFDLDGDGSTSCGGDCNDALASVRPGGVQICDGLNNNCNAPGWPSLAGTNEVDNDGDGTSGCQGDCDDTRSSVRPGGTQVCDGLNNDCGFPGWPALAGTNEKDDDGDNVSECQGDCDDAIPTRFPGATEINDGLDNQCPGDAGSPLVDEVAGDLLLTGPADATQICWPAQGGASLYEVKRSGSSGFTGGCTGAITGSACWNDTAVPPVGQAFHYLVRAVSPHLGSWGARSSGVERTALCGAESLCADGLDNDGDTLIDCADPDCLGQPLCAPSVFSFVDTFGDDVPTTSLFDFFSAASAGAGDYLFYAIHSPGPGDIAVCAERADFYRDNYLARAITGGSVASGGWSRWVRHDAGPWSDPVNASFENLFGPDCADAYAWCPESGLGGRSPAIVPSLDYECEVADLVLQCGDGTWGLTVKVGKSRIAACGF